MQAVHWPAELAAEHVSGMQAELGGNYCTKSNDNELQAACSTNVVFLTLYWTGFIDGAMTKRGQDDRLMTFYCVPSETTECKMGGKSWRKIRWSAGMIKNTCRVFAPSFNSTRSANDWIN